MRTRHAEQGDLHGVHHPAADPKLGGSARGVRARRHYDLIMDD